MIKELNRAYLGRGWSFLPAFNQGSNEVQMVTEEEDILQSLHILLSTRPGERVMQPNYGCNLDIMLFEPITTTLLTLVRDHVKVSILLYEPRIDLNRVEIDSQNVMEGVLHIKIDYHIRSTNSRFNFVYPFYLEENANLL